MSEGHDYEIEELKRKNRELEEENDIKRREIRRLHDVCRGLNDEIKELKDFENERRKSHKPYYLILHHNRFRGTYELIGPGSFVRQIENPEAITSCMEPPEVCYQTERAAERVCNRWFESAVKAHAYSSYKTVRINYDTESQDEA